jgi:serine/threonine protein kinase
MTRFRDDEEIPGFVIQKLLGQGGFGEAYLAKDTNLDRLVVIKCPRNDLRDWLGGRDDLVQEFQARFWVEARAQARLNHANACTVFAVDDTNKIIVMEYIDGKTLEQRRLEGSLPKNELISIIVAAAEAVVEAHSKHVLHRDLTMKNIMVTATNQVKVLDFGLAKLTDEEPFTKIAVSAGTPQYMSPEQQLHSNQVDERSDVFSFGVVIYRMVTGHFPYSNLFSVDADPDPPAPFDSFGCDPWPDLNLTVLTALQLNPVDRFQTMEDLLGELQAARRSLARAECSLSFFDTSTLLEVVCPAVPTKAGHQRSKRAQNQFEINHAKECAVTSPGVLAELLEWVLRLYFEGQDRGLKKDAHVQSVVTDAKSDMQHRRRQAGRSGPLSWDALTWDDKLLFLSSAKGLFRPRLQAMAAQLAIVEADPRTFLTKFFDLAVDFALPERDSRILAEAYSLQSTWVYSEEQRYRRKSYRSVIEAQGPNLYRLLEPEAVIGISHHLPAVAGGPPPDTVQTATL